MKCGPIKTLDLPESPIQITFQNMSEINTLEIEDLSVLELNPKVLTHAKVKDSRDTHKEKKHWKRNVKINVSFKSFKFFSQNN